MYDTQKGNEQKYEEEGLPNETAYYIIMLMQNKFYYPQYWPTNPIVKRQWD